MIRALIVDDEAPARLGIRSLIERTTDFEVVGEASDGPGALQAARRLGPDVVFLDIQMPGLGGLDVAALLDRGDPPLVVFVTAHQQYAVRAFDVRAVDYLTKPITPSRFRDTLERVRAAVAGADRLERHAQLVAFLETSFPEAGGALPRRQAEPTEPLRLTVRDGDRFIFVNPGDIGWIDTEGNYARLHVGAATYRIRATLAGLERRLQTAGFLRIHRAALVNRARIQEVRTSPRGDLLAVLDDGRELPVGRGYREALLGNP